MARPRVVYVHSFGSHRRGFVIRYGGAGPTGEAEGAGAGGGERAAGRSAGAGGGRHGALGSGAAARTRSEQRPPCPPGGKTFPSGDLQDAKADTFDFPFPSRNVDKVTKRKKKKSKVWLKVWKVISKMLEENETFRNRLLACSQLNEEGNDMNQSSQNEASYLDREETIFGWV